MFALLSGILLVGSTDTQKPPTVAEVEKAALEARTAIRTAYVRLKETNTYFVAKDTSIGTRTIWIDGKKIRGEIIREQGPDAGIRIVDCLNCEREGYGIYWMGTQGHVASMHAIGTKGKPGFDNALDVRQLGYRAVITVLLRPSAGRLDSLIGSTDRDEPALTSERLRDIDCWVLRWKHKSGMDVTVWIAPSKGNNVLRIQTVRQTKQGVRKRVHDSTLAPVGKSGLWFPSSVLFEEYLDETLEEREIIDVEEVRLNEPIDPSTFTLAGLNIAEGTYVQMPNPKDNGYLRGGKIDTSTPTTRFTDTTPAEPTPLNPQGKSVNYWLIAACAVFVIAAVALVVFRRRSVAAG